MDINERFALWEKKYKPHGEHEELLYIIAKDAVAALSSPHPEAREEDDKAYSEADMLALIDERDKAEGMVDSLLDIIGVEHEWSNAYNYSNALDDAQDALSRLAAPKPEGQDIIRCEITAGEYPDRISVKPPADTFERGLVVMGAMVDLVFRPAAPEPRPAEVETK